MFGAGAERTAAIDDRDPARLGFDDQAFENAIAGERDDVARIQREHPLVALEARTGDRKSVV